MLFPVKKHTRRFLAQRHLHNLQRERSAITIQRVFRGWHIRRLYVDYLEMVILIQAHIRAFFTRRRYPDMWKKKMCSLSLKRILFCMFNLHSRGGSSLSIHTLKQNNLCSSALHFNGDNRNTCTYVCVCTYEKICWNYFVSLTDSLGALVGVFDKLIKNHWTFSKLGAYYFFSTIATGNSHLMH